VPSTGIPARANADGVGNGPRRPTARSRFTIYKEGFAQLELEVTGGSTTRPWLSKAEHRITGTVTDAVPGKPIPSFTVIPVDVFAKDHLSAERFNGMKGEGR